MDSTSTNISYTSLAIGLLTCLLTALNLLFLSSTLASTIRDAPAQVPEVLASLREQLLEEREAIRQQTRELRQKKTAVQDSRRALHPAHAGRPRSSSRNRSAGGGGAAGGGGGAAGGGGLGLGRSSSNNLRGYLSLTHSEQTLALHSIVLRDLWRRFRVLERPFLAVAVPASPPAARPPPPPPAGSAAQTPSAGDAAGVRRPGSGAWGPEDDYFNEKIPREDLEMAGDAGGASSSAGMYRCDFMQRITWWRTKDDILRVADDVQRIAMRRMAREVMCCRMMMRQIRDGGEGPEDLASPVVEGGRFFDGHGGSGTLGMRRRPFGETSNVYESSEESDSSLAAKMRMGHRVEERDQRVRVSDGRRWPASPGRSPPRGDAPGSRYTGDGWRPGQYGRNYDQPFSRPPPIVLEAPRVSRPRSRPGLGHERHPGSYESRR